MTAPSPAGARCPVCEEPWPCAHEVAHFAENTVNDFESRGYSVEDRAIRAGLVSAIEDAYGNARCLSAERRLAAAAPVGVTQEQLDEIRKNAEMESSPWRESARVPGVTRAKATLKLLDAYSALLVHAAAVISEEDINRELTRVVSEDFPLGGAVENVTAMVIKRAMERVSELFAARKEGTR